MPEISHVKWNVIEAWFFFLQTKRNLIYICVFEIKSLINKIYDINYNDLI